MKDITLELIKNILAVDETVTKGKADDIIFVCTQETNSKQKKSNANLGFLQINGRCLSGLSIRDETNLRNTLFERGNWQFQFVLTVPAGSGICPDSCHRS